MVHRGADNGQPQGNVDSFAEAGVFQHGAICFGALHNNPGGVETLLGGTPVCLLETKKANSYRAFTLASRVVRES